jgi:anthranilate phosphoribosyltransferase
MGIAHYIKVIGRGKDGARALTREQAADLFGQVLDASVSDLEIGGFCLAMRIKGETAQEMAGFLDATYARLQRLPATKRPLVLLPSYNGARKLPVLTALLAYLLVRKGLPVLVHGQALEPGRVTTASVLKALGAPFLRNSRDLPLTQPAFCPIEVLSPQLSRLLDVRRVVGLRNPAHSLVKLMNPAGGPSLVIGSYTHTEYAQSMAASFELMQSDAMLLRGTEGEAVADARRTPQMEGFVKGQRRLLQAAQGGALGLLPELPTELDAKSTASYIDSVLQGRLPVPLPIAQQVEHILHLAECV